MAASMNSCAMNVKTLCRLLSDCHRISPSAYFLRTKTTNLASSPIHQKFNIDKLLICKKQFSSQISNANQGQGTGSITDSILHSRLSREEQDKNAEDTVKTNSENKEDQKDGDSKSDKSKGFTMFGKHVSWTAFGSGMFLSSLVSGFILLIGTWGPPERDIDNNPIEDEFSQDPLPLAYMRRTYREIFVQVKVTQEPSRQKLLPEPLSYPYMQPPYTLVLEMTDILVHPEWTMVNGWRFKKRPGIDHFLRAIGPPLFEVVIYTKESGMTADPLITKVDPENYIMYRLYKDATRYEDGKHIKDLNCLNRDLSKVIIIDWDSNAVKYNSDNMFCVKPWKGEDDDVVLGELAEFLRALAGSNVEDVRPVLQYYRQFDDPIDQFHKNQAKLREEQDRQKLAAFERGKKNFTSSFASKFKF
ncbi:mitochondrial import inner membrane translocase subunit TIM50-C-like [Mya arenaria]|uniref:mitochondrial import inner membrane translocase subunit TIM50-C-like n=1 Tax=Mya arenaria TaxID=6604 RepID=UPI0022E2224F|nr:mitochondrial import inner membrane translocase subunit TIM50-C-like [Mya arenaria]